MMRDERVTNEQLKPASLEKLTMKLYGALIEISGQIEEIDCALTGDKVEESRNKVTDTSIEEKIARLGIKSVVNDINILAHEAIETLINIKNTLKD